MAIIILLGPTASGKTRLGVEVAQQINAEIISADSRQVYQNMDLGTGKDLQEYKNIPYHLINILPAGQKYHLARFQEDFHQAVERIRNKNKEIVVVGGTGLYLQSIIQAFRNTAVPENYALREKLSRLNESELDQLLGAEAQNINTTKRKIRALEILEFKNSRDLPATPYYPFLVFGLNPLVETRRQLISRRLSERFDQGMIAEAENLLAAGVTHESLQYYGLEYKYISLYLLGEMPYTEMYSRLETEIHRFAKRQMTFFRSMEKKGISIDWIPENLTFPAKVDYIKKAISVDGLSK